LVRISGDRQIDASKSLEVGRWKQYGNCATKDTHILCDSCRPKFERMGPGRVEIMDHAND
jgi:hypothetical protein